MISYYVTAFITPAHRNWLQVVCMVTAQVGMGKTMLAFF
jgi:hypothetical protein